MIIGIGIDLVKTARVQAIVKRWGERFLNRVFTPSETAYSLNRRQPHIPLSARFAVKEATLKALGIGVQMGIRWREIETVHDPLGKPMIRLSGKVQKIAQDKQVSDIFASLSHDGDYAIAQVILTGHSR